MTFKRIITVLLCICAVGLLAKCASDKHINDLISDDSADITTEVKTEANDSSDDESSSGTSQNATLPEDTADSERFIDEAGVYTSKNDVALYIHTYGRLPQNFITKKSAEELGWIGGSLEPYAPGMCIGGDRFGNYEGLLPDAPGRTYKECDIDTLGASSRGAKRIIFSNDGLIFYTSNHYVSFELLYGGDQG